MASVKDYMFDNMSRIGNDNCGVSQRNVQNVKNGNYILTNPFNGDCLMNKSMDFALSQPNVNYTGTREMAADGCNVDINSQLKIGSEQTQKKINNHAYPICKTMQIHHAAIKKARFRKVSAQTGKFF